VKSGFSVTVLELLADVDLELVERLAAGVERGVVDGLELREERDDGRVIRADDEAGLVDAVRLRELLVAVVGLGERRELEHPLGADELREGLLLLLGHVSLGCRGHKRKRPRRSSRGGLLCDGGWVSGAVTGLEGR
jgi:hypothetical protein